MGLDTVRRALKEAGLEPDELGWGDDDVEHRWTVRPADPEGRAFLLGGLDHGAWRTWREVPATPGGIDDLVKALWDVRRSDQPERIPRNARDTARAAALGVQMMDRAAALAGGSDGAAEVLPASEVKVGTPLDHVGDVSGHVLHHFGTPWDRRALAATDSTPPVRGYLLVHVLPVGCRAERVAPAHGQPGGGWRVVLDRPVAAYVESGALRPFLPSDA